MLLHTVNKNPDSCHTLASALYAALPGSCLLLIEDAVYAAVSGSRGATMLKQRSDVRCYVLREDVQARGIASMLDGRIQPIDYAGFVTLSTQCHAVQSWY